MAVTRQQKEEILSGLVDKFGRSKSVVFAKNLGLTVNEISDLRKALRVHGVEFVIAKKTLFQKAAEANGISGFTQETIGGPVGAAFSYQDPIISSKILAKFAKTNEKIEMSIGIMDKKLMSALEVLTLSRLPSREELLAKFLGSLVAPLSGFVGIGRNLLGGFVRALDQVRAQEEIAG